MSEINAQHFLGSSTKLSIETKDVAGDAQTAASEVSQAKADKKYPAVIGNVLTPQAAAAAPIAGRAKLPIIFSSSGKDGVVNTHSYVLATPVEELKELVTGYLQKKGAKKLGIIYNSEYGTLANLAKKTLPRLGSKYGYSVVATTAVRSSTVDLAAPVNKLIDAGADSIALELVGAQGATAVKQLRQGGFTGPIISQAGVGGGALTPAGQDGVGVTWSNDFSATDQSPSVQKFVKAFTDKYGATKPINTAAEAYDSTWLLARALKQANSTDRAAVQRALQKITADGIDGVSGRLTFEDNAAHAPGVLVQWDGKAEIAAPTS